MFAIFSVGVTLFASSSSFPFVVDEDSNQLRKMNFLSNFNYTTTNIEEIEKFILYNADLSMDKRELKHNVDLDYQKSIEMYRQSVAKCSNTDIHTVDEIRLHLAIIPVFYNSGDEKSAKETLDCVKNSNFFNQFKNTSISTLKEKEKDYSLYYVDVPLMKYWYASYVLAEESGEFPGCSTNIFNDKSSIIPNSTISPEKQKPKCTHQELQFIDETINDLNYDSYYFDIGNKHQSTEKIFHQDEIREFFEDYMNWLILGVVLIVLVGWTTITKPQDDKEEENS